MNENDILRTPEAVSPALRCLANPPHRVLVVEDEPVMCQINMKMLIDAGYQVDAAEDGAVAWDILQQKPYDLVITDNNMPKVSGLELIEKVRSAGLPLPVIMATGTSPKEEFIQRPDLLPTATLIKPYTLVEFLGTVKTVLCAATLI